MLIVQEGFKQSPVGAIPQEWNVVNFESILIAFQNGNAFSAKKYVEQGVPIITMANISLSGRFLYNETKLRYWISCKYDSLQSFHVGKGDLIIAMTDVTPSKSLIGRTAVVNIDKNFLLNQRVGLLQLKKDKANTDYINYFTNSDIWRKYCLSVSALGAQANIGTSQIKNGLIALPPLPEQQKIASILSAVDNKLDLIDRKITATCTLTKGLMQRLFSQGVGTRDANGHWQPHIEFKDSELGQIPTGWDIQPISKVTTYVDYRGKTPPKTSSGVFLVTAKNIKKGYIDYECSTEYVSADAYDEVMSRGKPSINDVLITTEAPLGNIALVDRTDIVIAQRVIKYRANAGLLPLYLKYYFLSETFQCLLDMESTGSTVKGIKGSRLHKLPVIMPPSNEQKEIEKMVSSIEQKIHYLIDCQKQIQKLKKGLMQKLLTGQLRVTV